MAEILKTVSKVEDMDDEKRIVVGIISTDSVDRHGEVIDTDHLEQAMAGFQAVGGPVVYAHQYGGKLGHMVRYERLKRPNRIRTWTQVGRDRNILTYFGPINVDDLWKEMQQHPGTWSIGGNGDVVTPTDEDGVATGPPSVHLTDLYEYSYVVIPANRGAVFEQVIKAAGLFPKCTRCADAQRAVDQKLATASWQEVAEMFETARRTLDVSDGMQRLKDLVGTYARKGE